MERLVMKNICGLLSLAFSVCACNQGGSTVDAPITESGAFSTSSLPPSSAGWMSTEFAAPASSSMWVACAQTEGTSVSVVEGFPYINEGQEILIQTLDLSGMLATGLTTTYDAIPGDLELAVHGFDPVLASGSVQFFRSVTGVANALEATPSGTLSLGAGLVPISVGLGRDGLWWAATVDGQGDIHVHRMTDQDLDGIPDQQTIFADLTGLATDYGSVIAGLATAPFQVEADDNSEVYIRQASALVLRLVDSDTDGSADMALFAERREGPGSAVTDGAWPGSGKILSLVFPNTNVELYRVDGTGSPVELLASGISNTDGEWVADLVRPLVVGDSIAVLNLDTSQVGAIRDVGLSTAPAVMRTTSSEIPLGGTISLYMPNAVGQSVQVFWEYLAEENFPVPTSQGCDLVRQVGAVREYVLPMPTDTPIGLGQTVKVVIGGEARPKHIAVKVRDLPSSPELPFLNMCSGDGGNQLGCTDCPCGNNAPMGTVGGCLNSAGSSARLEATGDPSVSLPAGITTDLRFALSSAVPASFAILNSGDAVAPNNPMNMCFGMKSGAQALAFDGLRCAVENTTRHGGRGVDNNGEVGTTTSPWGGEGGPPVGIAQAGAGFAAGTTRYFQAIYRDDVQLSCMRGENTSQAVEVTFEP